MPNLKPRFDVFTLVEWTAAIAFICALMAGSGGRAAWTTDFKSLPRDDSALLSWLEEMDRKDVTVTRQNNSITLEVKHGILTGIFITGIFSDFDRLPKPSWQELGYPPPQGMSGSASWTWFSGSAYLWIVGFGILILLGRIRKRFITPQAVGS